MPDFSLRESSLLEVGLRAIGRCPVAASGATCRVCLNAAADRHIVKRPPPDPKALPIRALNISVHPHYPLLSTAQQPLPFVRPADVMPPTAMEAEFGLASDNNNLPVVTIKSLSASVVLKNGTYQMPSRVSIGPLLQSPVSQPTTPIARTMGQPPRPVKKREHVMARRRSAIELAALDTQGFFCTTGDLEWYRIIVIVFSHGL
jgi:hypothetical protein